MCAADGWRPHILALIGTVMFKYWTAEDGTQWATENGKILGTKYFCIGLGKTGTTTFGVCAKRLGLKHFGSGLVKPFRDRDFEAVANIIKNHDSFDDYPWPLIYEWLDAVCEDARFAITLRDPDKWLASLKHHYDVTGPTLAKKVFFGYYSPYENEVHHRAAYVDHVARVRKSFDHERRLLEINWSDGSTWDEVAQFFGKPAPQGLIPVANRRKGSPETIARQRLLSDAKLEMIEGSPSVAIASFGAVLKKNPEFAPAWSAMSQQLNAVGLRREAIEFVTQAIQLAPDEDRYSKLKYSIAAQPILLPDFDQIVDEISAYFDGTAKTKAGDGVCIVLLLNRKFLVGLFSVLASIMKFGTLRGASIAIMTDDPAVAHSSYIRRIARFVRTFQDRDLTSFQNISNKHVKKGERGVNIPKYTLWKFHFFDEIGLGDQVFIDCDMIVTRSLDDVIFERQDKSLLVVQEIPHDLKMAQNVDISLRGEQVPEAVTINSGFMIARNRFLRSNRNMVDELVKIAERSDFSKEQKVVTEYILSGKDYEYLSCEWNFLKTYAGRMNVGDYDRIKSRIRVYHYVGLKPWERHRSELTTLDDPWEETMKWAEERWGLAWQRLFARSLIASGQVEATGPEMLTQPATF